MMTQKNLMPWLESVQLVTKRSEHLTGRTPDKVAVIPARVALIDGLDYQSCFGHMPLPSDARFIVMAVGLGGNVQGNFALAVDRADAPSTEFPIRLSHVSRFPLLENGWANGILAGYLGMSEAGLVIPSNIQLVVSGTGLRSASLLVVSSVFTLSSMCATHHLSRTFLDELCVKSRSFVEVTGGDIGQAAMMICEPGFSMISDTRRIRVESIPLVVHGLSLIVANPRGVSAELSVYNKHLFECKLGAYFLRSEHSQEPIVDTLAKAWVDLGSPPFDTMISDSYEFLDNGRQFPSPPVMNELFYSHALGNSVSYCTESFSTQDRAVQVFSEAQRLVRFFDATRTGAIADEEESHPEHRLLIKMMKDEGCLGAHVTCAGWGTCVVGIVEAAKADQVVERIRRDYFEPEEEIYPQNADSNASGDSLGAPLNDWGSAFLIQS